MLIPEEHDMYELRNCLEDMYGVWPFMEKLPRVSSNWVADSENTNPNKPGHSETFYCHFATGTLVVTREYGRVYLSIRDKED